MQCTISKVDNAVFTVQSGEKINAYQFSNGKSANIERAKMIKHLKSKGCKILFN